MGIQTFALEQRVEALRAFVLCEGHSDVPLGHTVRIDELDDFWEDEPDYSDDDYGSSQDEPIEIDELAEEEHGQDQNASSSDSSSHAQSLQRELQRWNLERAEQFVEALNHLVRKWPEFLTVTACYEGFQDGPDGRPVEESFWLGTLAKPEGGIDFTQGASSRAKDLLFVVAAMWLFDQTTDPHEESKFQEFWDLCQQDDGWSICMRTKRAIRRFCKRDAGAAARILNAGDYEFTDAVATELMEERMSYLWALMEL